MFEHSMMTRKLKQRLNRVISVTMSVAMLVGTLPADLLGGIASVKAEAGTSTFLDVSVLDDGDIKQEQVLGDTIYVAQGDSTHALTVAKDEQTIGDKSFTKSLKLIPGTSIQFDAAGAGELNMYLMADSGDGSKDGTDDAGDTGDKGDVSGSNLPKAAVEPAADAVLTVQKKGAEAVAYSVTKEGGISTFTVDEAAAYTLTVTSGTVKVFGLELTYAGSDSIVKRYVLDTAEIKNGVDPSDATKDKDKEEYADGAKLGTEDYYEVWLSEAPDGDKEPVKGTVVKRNSKTVGGNIKGLEINKWGSAGIKFIVQGTADAELVVSSTGGSNESSVALADEQGNIIKPASVVGTATAAQGPVAEDDGSYVVYGNETTPTTMTFKGLKAGTYTILSPRNEKCNRGMWLIKATVDDTVPVVHKQYVLDAAEIKNGVDPSDATKDKDKEEYADGAKLGTEDYYEVWLSEAPDGDKEPVKGTVVKRNSKTVGGNIKGLEINKWGSAGIKFTVQETADAELVVSSTGGSNESSVALVNEQGNIIKPASVVGTATAAKGPVAEDDGSYVVYGNETTPTTMTFKGLKAGTYTILSPRNEKCNRGMWLIKATVDAAVVVNLVTKDYVVDAAEIKNGVDPSDATKDKDKEEYADGAKLGTEDYYEVWLSEAPDGDKEPVKGTVVKRNSKTVGGNIKGLEINKWGSAGIKFTVQGTADAELKVSSTGGSNESSVALVDEQGNIVKPASVVGTETAAKGPVAEDDGSYVVYGNETTPTTMTFKGLKAGTYTILSPRNEKCNRGMWLIRAAVTDTFEESAKPEEPVVRAPWADVAGPEIVSVELNAKNAKQVDVVAKGLVGTDGADKLVVDMLDENGDVLKSVESTTRSPLDKATNTYTLDKTFNFTPGATGDYSFVARMVREDEEDKVSEEMAFSFGLPLDPPSISSVTNKCTDPAGKKGALEIIWDKTAETKSYRVTLTKVENGVAAEKPFKTETTSKQKILISGLEVGTTVNVAVVAIGIYEDEKGKSKESDPATRDNVLITANNDRTWGFSAWGSSISLKSNDYTGSADSSVTIRSEGGAGKIVPGSTDGLAFYYTTIDPATENFILTANVHVNSWTYSNGQDGFGMMVSDAIGNHGDGNAFWNNSYQLLATKIEYRWDKVNNKITDVVDLDNTVRYSMRLGLGWIAKNGVTATDVAKINLGEQTMPNAFSTESGTLETSAARLGEGGTPLPAGDYNIIGNGKAAPTSIQELTDFKMQIQRNNTGYILRYLSNEPEKDENGAVKVDENGDPVYTVIGSQTFYDEDRNTLTQIDKRGIYVGFFAARNANITVSDIDMVTSDPNTDPPAESRPVTYVDPDFQITSSATSNSEYYELIAKGNMDGRLTIVNETTGEVIAQGEEVAANQKYVAGLTLQPGENKFSAILVPNQGYVPSEFERMTSLDPIKKEHVVTFNVLSGTELYVAPDGTSAGLGTKESPLDIQTAVAYAQAGQKIILASGRYELGKKAPGNTKADTLLVDRGHNGTEKEPIYMVAAPDATGANRPVLDFAGQTTSDTAFTIAGDYWYLKGFDVTNSRNSQKGIQVSGDYNVLEDIRTYKNGNTGIQIARYQSDGRADWPSYNTILNCTSYLNADSGYEDADGFACKLTAGDGNKFVGCIAAYNADDGWDLFAKVESGSIGSVTIQNCVAFKNGYVMTVDGKQYSEIVTDGTGIETSAGNGNGFKMGGDSMSGYHVLQNSIAFGNKAKGIDSNSCPDNQVYNSTSFDNESYNVALYTNSSPNTDYNVSGVLSVKTANNAALKKGNSIVAEQLKPQGTQNDSKIYGENNYYYDGNASYKSYNNHGASDKTDEASAAWFKNTDMDKAIKGGITRNADGSINMNGFLELKDEYLSKGAGAALGSTSPETVLQKAAEVSVYASTVTTLKDVKLPEELADYEWKYPDTAVAVFAGTSTEFVAVPKQDDSKAERAVIVNFIEVTGVEIQADKDMLIGEDTLTLTAAPVLAPAVELEQLEKAQGSASINITITETDRLGLTAAKVPDLKNQAAVTVTRGSSSGEGLAKFTAAMNATIAGKTVKKQAVFTFTTRKTAFDVTYTVDPASVVGADGSIVVSKGDTFTLKDLAAVGVGSNTGVKLSSSDSKVIKISGTTVSAVNEGTAAIIMTAAADKTAVKKVIVTVRGASFKTSVSNIILDKAKTEGVQITAVACYGDELRIPAQDKWEKDTEGKPVEPAAVRVKSVLRGKTATAYAQYFTAVKVLGNIYTIQLSDEGAKNISNGTYNLVLEGYLNGEAYTEFEPVTMKIMETRPTVSIKQKKKANLFYTAGSTSGYGNLTATSKLAGVTLTQLDAASADFKLTAAKNGYNVALKKTKLKGERVNNQIKVHVSYTGYRETYGKDMIIRVSTERRAPKLKLEVDNRILYTAIGIKNTELRILDTATNTYVISADVALASSKKSYQNANKNFELYESNMIYTLSAKKSGTAKISVQDVDWTEEVILNQPITVNNKPPKTTFAVTKLNSASEYVGKEQSSALITVKNALDYKVKDLVLTGSNAKATELLKYLNYKVGTNELGQSVLLVSFKTKDEEGKALTLPANLKKGSYTFKAKFSLNKLKDQQANVKVTILPTAIVTTSQKGSIDLVNRAGSSVTVKPNLRNLNGAVVGMTLDDDASNLFEVEWDSAKQAAVVKAKENIDMKKGVRYKVTPVFQVLTNGGTVNVTARTIAITPKQSNLKFTQIPVMETRLSAIKVSARAVVKAKSPANAEILEMVQMSNLENFKVDYDFQSGALKVRITDVTGLKAGSTYRIKLALDVKDAGVNTKQQVITVPVKVLK